MTNADVSGMLRFLTDELQDAEDAGDRGTFHILRRPFGLTAGNQCGSSVMSSLVGTAAIR